MRAVRYVFLTLAIIVVVFVAGPRVDTSTTQALPPVPPIESIEQHIKERETAFVDVTPGTEAQIIWADSVRQKTPYALVYIHGFSGTHRELAPAPDSIAARLGANLFYARLRGHGRSGEALADVSLREWTEDVAHALSVGSVLGERVVLMGTSNGGALAAWLAAQPLAQGKLAALVLVSPNFEPADSRSGMLLWPWGGALANLVVGPERNWQPVNEAHALYSTERYPTRALLPMMATVEVLREADLSGIDCPTVIVYSTMDRVISIEALLEAQSRFGPQGVELIDMGETGDPSHHLIAGDVLSPMTTADFVDEVSEFLDSYGIATR